MNHIKNQSIRFMIHCKGLWQVLEAFYFGAGVGGNCYMIPIFYRTNGPPSIPIFRVENVLPNL